MHRVVFSFGVVGRGGLGLVAFGRAVAVPVAEDAGCLVDGRTPASYAGGAALDRSLGQSGVTDAQVDVLDASPQGVGGDLG
jgi:hypothetical protein